MTKKEEKKFKIGYGSWLGKEESTVYRAKITAILSDDELNNVNDYITQVDSKDSYMRDFNKKLNFGYNYPALTTVELFVEYFKIKYNLNYNTIIEIKQAK